MIDSSIAVPTLANAEPVTHDSSTVVASEQHLTPAEKQPFQITGLFSSLTDSPADAGLHPAGSCGKPRF